MKSVVITGSSKGIGLGMCLEFLKRGCSVLVSSRKQADVDAAVTEFSAQFGAEKVIGLDLRCDGYTQVQALWDAAAQNSAKSISGSIMPAPSTLPCRSGKLIPMKLKPSSTPILSAICSA